MCEQEMRPARRRTLFAFGSIALLLLLVSGVRRYLLTRPETRAKITTTRMSRLMTLLRADEPATVTPGELATLLAKYGRSLEYLEDGWGRPLAVERLVSEPEQVHYRITSLGRDGRPGKCCEKWVSEHWDEDAVLFDSDWLQVW